jgi:signal transduction histidine kinase
MNPELQILIQTYESAPTVTEKLDALAKVIIFCDLNTMYELGLQYVAIAEELLQNNDNIEYTNAHLNILKSLGNISTKLGDYSKAIIMHSEAERIALLLRDKKSYIRALFNLAIVYYYLGEYPKALENILFCIKNDADSTETNYNHLYYNALGEIYRQMGNNELALVNLFHTLDILSNQPTDNRTKGQCLQNIGSVYLSDKQYDNSLTFFLKALDVYQKHGFMEFEAAILNNLGALFGTMEQYQTAIEYFTKAIDLHEKLGRRNRDSLANVLCNLAEAYFKIGKSDLAINYLLQALSIAEPIDAKHRLFEIHDGLYTVYKELKDYPKALYHHELFMKYKEQVYSKEANEKLQRMTIVHQVETLKKERQIEQVKNFEMSVTNQKLKELNDEKDGFLAIAAHDLKNPLTGILYIANTMKSGNCMSDEIIEFGEMLRSSAQAMFDLISNLLDSNKYESGGIQPAFASIDAAQLSRHLAKNYSRNAANKDIKVRCKAPEHAFVDADMQLLRQAIDNLLSNAVKYSPFGSEIIIEVLEVPENSTVAIKVIDSGPGISDDDRKKLFRKFQRLSAKPTAGEHSTGLGLSICKKLIEMMRGTIRCESQIGFGATFIIELQSAQEEVYHEEA